MTKSFFWNYGNSSLLKLNVGLYVFWTIFLCFLVRYNVFSVYCTLSQTDNSSVKKEDFRFKWDFMWKNLLKLKFNSIQLRYIRFLPNFWCLCHFFIEIRQQHTFFFGQFTSNFADTMSIIAKTTAYLVLKDLYPSYICIS